MGSDIDRSFHKSGSAARYLISGGLHWITPKFPCTSKISDSDYSEI